MKARAGFRASLACTVGYAAFGLMVAGIISCGSAPTPFVVRGPGSTGGDPPTLEITDPIVNLTRGRGDPFVIRWRDTDPDSNAQISFSLVNVVTNERIVLVAGLDENDTIGPDQVTVATDLIPVGGYNLIGQIDDSQNPVVEVAAMTQDGAAPQRLIVTISEPGQGPPTVPPVITVTQPAFNQSVAQDDVLTVVVQPTALFPDPNDPNPVPFDPDSNVTLFVLLDTDLDPNNDDPANPDDSIIVLRVRAIEQNDFQAITFDIPIDLITIPPRADGSAYNIRVTADDGNNPRIHQYAIGTISVAQLASGTVDLFEVGRVVSGARWYGFNPGANLGSSISGVTDFDADGVADFVLVAQFGNARNQGLVGEAYLIYGIDQTRFGGSIAVNSVSDTISGVIFEAPPVRRVTSTCSLSGVARTDGITDVSFVPDLTGDGRPDLLFGFGHVHGAFDSMDFDPSDADVRAADNTIDRVVEFRQGQVPFPGGNPLTGPQGPYNGVDDLFIDSANPNTPRGADQSVSWKDNGAGDRQWGLISFSDVLDLIPDSIDDINFDDNFDAQLRFRVFNQGASARVFQEFSGFTEQTTFGTYAVNGDEPMAGVDYDDNELDMIDGSELGTVEVDVTSVVRDLFEGNLQGFNAELRFIIVPDTGDAAADDAGVRSSEFGNAGNRPSLRIEYQVVDRIGAEGCYPDNLVNNRTNPDPNPDLQEYAGGMAVIINSENRDSRPRINGAPRLDSTTVTLELVGQDGRFALDSEGVNTTGGGIFPRADDPQQPDRIAGARFIGGPVDCVDHLALFQPAREGLFGQNVGSLGDLNNDGIPEIVISAPTNEAYLADLLTTFGGQSTHFNSTGFDGSIVVLPGTDYNNTFWRDKSDPDDSSSTIPVLDQQGAGGRCTRPQSGRRQFIPQDAFEVFAEDINDRLGGALSAGDFNQDGIDDILCGAPLNDRRASLPDSGAAYVLYGRSVLGDYDLTLADDPINRTPMLRIRGESPGDQIGWRQATGLDVNGDRIDDVFISSPRADFGGVVRTTCARDFNRDGVVNSVDLSASSFSSCRASSGGQVFSDASCKAFDYDNDEDIDDDDETVFFCLSDGGGVACCGDLVDNGFVGVVFGGVFTDGDRTISQIATSDLAGAIFFGAATGHRAGYDVSSAGDFNQDGFGDILITVPGETRIDRAGRERLGVVYLVFGGTHLQNTRWSLDRVGSEDLPGIVFLSPFTKGAPNEAAPLSVAFLGDINRDGFGDIAIGNPKADFIDFSFPQGPNASDAELGRRRDAGDAYVIYGNNFGSNRATP